MWFIAVAALAVVVVYFLKNKSSDEVRILAYHGLFVPDDIAQYCRDTRQDGLVAEAILLEKLTSAVLKKYRAWQEIPIEDVSKLLDLNKEMRRLFERAGMGGSADFDVRYRVPKR